MFFMTPDYPDHSVSEVDGSVSDVGVLEDDSSSDIEG